MEIRNGTHPQDAKHYTTERLREEYLIPQVFIPGEIKLVYSHVDRMIAGGACPTDKPLMLEAGKEIGAEFFLARREMGIINIGGKGTVKLDGEVYTLDSRDGLYVGMGIRGSALKVKMLPNGEILYQQCSCTCILPDSKN